MTTATLDQPRTRNARKPRPTIADKAEMLVSNAATWLRCRDRHSGRLTAYGIPSLTVPGKYHLTNGQGCDCKAGQAGRECCHRTAAARYISQRKAEAACAASLADRLLLDGTASIDEWFSAVVRTARQQRDAAELEVA